MTVRLGMVGLGFALSCGGDETQDLLRPIDEPLPAVGPDLGSALPESQPELGGALRPEARSWLGEEDERLGAPHPIVLAHGFFGFEELAGIDAATYFYQVKADLAEFGEVLVFTPAVDPFNDSTTRAMQLIEAVESILAETGHRRVNVIGHSQGGLDARAAAHLRPDLFASVTTFATPHQGTAIADIALNIVPNEQAGAVVDWVVRQLGGPLYDAVGEETSLSKSLHQLSEAGMLEFNQKYPDRPGVAYFSIAGRSDGRLARAECAPDLDLEMIHRFDGRIDPIDPALLITESVLDGGLFENIPNDGLVAVESARWGVFLGCVPADHLDQIGHLFGDQPGLGNPWRHKPFFRDLVAWLRSNQF